MGKQKVIVIGNGMVGHKFLETVATLPENCAFEMKIIGEEPNTAYDRVHLSEFFSGKTAGDLSLVPDNFYQDNSLKVASSTQVTEIDRINKEIHYANGNNEKYDKLVLATGSYPFVPPIPGKDRDNVFVYRTIEDLKLIAEGAKNSRVGVVIGGGLLGLEAAKALKDLGLETHVVEFAPQLMAIQLDETGGELLRKKIENLGVSVHTSKNTKQITDGGNFHHKLCFADGSFLETDLILFSAGIRPRDDLAKQSGLDMGERGGIVINDRCQTSDPDIYAIGECALWDNKIFGLVAPGYQMAKVAANQICQDQSDQFTGADMSTKLKLLGVDVASIGDAHGRTPGSLSYKLIDDINGIYKKVVVDAKRKKLLGAILIGEADSYGTLLQFALNESPIPNKPEQLILPANDGDNAALGVEALPDEAQICSCNNVSKAELCTKVREGCIDLGELKSCTKAGTSCGGCAPLVKQILDSELAKQGLEVKKDLCEHFPYSRQELFHLARVHKIKTFEDLIEQHGKGNIGCDICKPTAASIFASLWNEYILNNGHAGLQDTNDYYLANMQKDGTYSVVPRVAGGEITPDKLIVLGQVAKKYDLYTKITGGQRVDLFGARVDQLPKIWSELVAAGFESGHAYGKSVRTVKSCVGSTWCRYGVQDSVGQAIHLEERYKGLRSPHKLKFAVSGCTRECAEAQSKDVGVIATEKGWNLYVCGNGGMKPRHADLLASDLTDQALIQYTDRFLMFYISTADRLQRTSVWLDNLEGGIDYVKDVVINDSLGIGKELEDQMHHVINTYQCEWKTTIESPEKMKRFTHFVNSKQSDQKLQYVRERGQKRPATQAEKQEMLNTIPFKEAATH